MHAYLPRKQMLGVPGVSWHEGPDCWAWGRDKETRRRGCVEQGTLACLSVLSHRPGENTMDLKHFQASPKCTAMIDANRKKIP